MPRILDPSLVPADGRAALDISYLEVLPDDAIPVIVQALPHLRAPDQAAVRRILDERRRTLASDSRYAGLAAWNLGRERARDALRRLP